MNVLSLTVLYVVQGNCIECGRLGNTSYTRLVRLTTHTDYTTLHKASRMALGWQVVLVFLCHTLQHNGSQGRLAVQRFGLTFPRQD